MAAAPPNTRPSMLRCSTLPTSTSAPATDHESASSAWRAPGTLGSFSCPSRLLILIARATSGSSGPPSGVGRRPAGREARRGHHAWRGRRQRARTVGWAPGSSPHCLAPDTTRCVESSTTALDSTHLRDGRRTNQRRTTRVNSSNTSPLSVNARRASATTASRCASSSGSASRRARYASLYGFGLGTAGKA